MPDLKGDKDKQGFIVKVFSILSFCLLITALFTVLVFNVEPMKKWMQSNAWAYYTAVGCSFVLAIIISCCKGARVGVPLNYILLFAYVLCEMYIVAGLCTFFPAEIVLSAALLTFFMTCGLTAYSCFMKSS